MPQDSTAYWRGWQEPLTIVRGKQMWEMIPTWQEGRVILPDADYSNLVQNGYNSHALIHACISLLAMSAAVPPLRVRVGDQLRPNHRLAALMARPNPSTTGLEFKHLMLTHLLCSGNAYIELVPSSAGLITQMGLLRPDRVEIIPGATQEEDIYEYTITPDRKRRLPPSLVIHVKLPHPSNDFYGLPPPAVAAREANLDLDATLLTKSFFENGGIPLGVMTIEGRRADEGEKKRIKSAWRRAFNRAADGTRRFFDLLVMNASEAKYQPLGLPIKDLEMPETRDLVETRICMVFHVPAMMVGALVGYKHATYSNFEVAEKALWRYGVAYYLAIIRERLQAELVPRFKAQGEGPITIEHDLSIVPALAEDNTEKAKAAAGLIATGAYTANQANMLLGLPAVEGGDVYVRTITQEVIPASFQAKAAQIISVEPPRQLTSGVKARTERLAGVFEVLRARHVAKLAGPLQDYFDEQANHVRKEMSRLAAQVRAQESASRPGGAMKATGVRAHNLLPEDAEEALRKLLAGHWIAIDQSIHAALADVLGLPAYEPTNPVVDYISARGSERVVQVTEATKAAINEQLITAEQRGYGLWQAAHGVPADDFRGVISVVEQTYKNRHLAIARTEAGFATLDAAHQRYLQAGITELDLIDGDACNQGCAERNGTRVPIRSNPTLLHPNCTLITLPVLE